MIHHPRIQLAAAVFALMCGTACERPESTPADAVHRRRIILEDAAAAETQRDAVAPAPAAPALQGESELDLSVTQKVRQAVMQDDTLSMSARSTRVTTLEGIVTLRGTVKNDQERARIVGIAERTVGVKRVDSRLQLAPN